MRNMLSDRVRSFALFKTTIRLPFLRSYGGIGNSARRFYFPGAFPHPVFNWAPHKDYEGLKVGTGLSVGNTAVHLLLIKHQIGCRVLC